MFCPQCKAEYRQGFTRCADCDVELVHGLPEAEEGASNDMRAGTLVPLWEGEDLALHTTLLEELEAAGIRYYDRPMGVYPGVRRWDSFPIQPIRIPSGRTLSRSPLCRKNAGEIADGKAARHGFASEGGKAR